MKVFRISRGEIEELRELVIRYRPDWPAVFSCNNSGDVWLFATYGYTDEGDRVKIDHPLLARIADERMDIHSVGGRFFVDYRGAFWKNEDGKERIIVRFEFTENVRERSAKAKR